MHTSIVACKKKRKKSVFRQETQQLKRFRTDDKVDLRSKVELEQLVAHELGHFDIFDDSVLGNTLFKIIY